MKALPAFKVQESSLHGQHLIEAGAGTGKTFTIEGVFYRLVAEEQIPVEKILVITFTEAATAELKARIRAKLVRELAEKQGLADADRLQNALRNFDEAAIFTIHGFCLRMLQENSFESGSLFDTELVTDQSDLILEIIEDFWRIQVYDASPLWGSYFKQTTRMNQLRKDFSGKTGQPYLKLIPAVEPFDKERIKQIETQYAKGLETVRQTWERTKDEVEQILVDKKTELNRNSHPIKKIPVWMAEIEKWLNSDYSLDLPQKFFRFCTSGLVPKKNKPKPNHILFEQCERFKTKSEALREVFDHQLIAFKQALHGYLRDELTQRKRRQNIRAFDDLLLDLWRALRSDAGDALAASIRNKYDAAMIDEFQDTDPVQYDIFTRIFKHVRIRLFLVGDPKQAIYSFRGADIFAYLNAKNQINRQSSLKHNWRSEPELVQAVNAFFDRAHPPPFVYADIGFEPARTPDDDQKQTQTELLINGRKAPPCRVWQLNSTLFEPDELNYQKKGNPINKDAAQQRIYQAVVKEIGRLLALGKRGEAVMRTISKDNHAWEQNLAPRDIAVLVLRNSEALEMQQALGQAHIPSVLHTKKSVFESHEALELRRILAALAEPGRERLIKAALCTDIFGVDGNTLENWIQNQTEFEKCIEAFWNYHELWRQKGFMTMFRFVLVHADVLPRLIALRDGERRITNLLHLAEILHQALFEHHLGVSELVNWLTQKISNDSFEEHLLRLESDADAVQLVTVHKSKGLEYPIVFCPFLWNDFDVKPPYCFHATDDSDSPPSDAIPYLMDLASKQDNQNKTVSQKRAEKERLAENLRLLYVALTRARNRCYLTWGRINQAGTSALAYLLHAPADLGDDWAAAINKRYKALKDDDISEALEQLRQKSGGQITVADITQLDANAFKPFDTALADAASTNLAARPFNANIRDAYRIASYSALVSSHSATPVTGASDSDRADEPSIFTFPRGAIAGECLHAIFEDLDFTETDAGVIADLVATKLEQYGYDAEIWGACIAQMVKNTLSVKLARRFSLESVSAKNRITEMEFFFSIKSLSPRKLAAVFTQYPLEIEAFDMAASLQALAFSQLKGFMHGFIDLVFRHDGRFYIIDWKSNHLGDAASDYTAQAINQSMFDHYYVLQYHLYVTALHRYLNKSLPGYDYDTHFGGVFYIFLRGVQPDNPESGVFYDRPPVGRIEALDGL